jgi:hypothetical protein
VKSRTNSLLGFILASDKYIKSKLHQITNPKSKATLMKLKRKKKVNDKKKPKQKKNKTLGKSMIFFYNNIWVSQ